MLIKFNSIGLKFFLEINFLTRFFVDYPNYLCVRDEILFAKWFWRCMAGGNLSIEII